MQNLIDGVKIGWMAHSRMAESPEDVAERIVLLRETLGYGTSIAFAKALRVSPQRLNNVEVGIPLSRDLAFRLVKFVPGLTLDWLYFGKPEGLPVELARRLGALETARSGKTPSR